MGIRQSIVALALASLPLSTSAATLTGRIWTSPGNQPLSGATITINNCGEPVTVSTDSNGNYRASVKRGTCQLTVSEHNPPPISVIVSGSSITANLELRKSGNQWRLIRR